MDRYGEIVENLPQGKTHKKKFACRATSADVKCDKN